MTMTIMYLAVAFLLAALVVSGIARVRGLEFAHGSPLDAAAILLVVALVIDLLAQLAIGTQGWMLTSRWQPKDAPDTYLWKMGFAAQGLAIVFLVLGIWRLFAAVGQLQPAGKPRAANRPAPAPAPDDAE